MIFATVIVLSWTGSALAKSNPFWRCRYQQNCKESFLERKGYTELNEFVTCENGYLSHKAASNYEEGPFSWDCEMDYGDDLNIFEETSCICATYFTGCFCENSWFEDCHYHNSYTVVLYLQNCMLLLFRVSNACCRSYNDLSFVCRLFLHLLWDCSIFFARSDRAHDGLPRNVWQPGAKDT